MNNVVTPPIVCVGASAGGLEAIERFFKHCPTDLNVAYVVIQHLSSHYKSMMDDLINRYSSMPVQMISSGDVPKANVIYLIEAGTIISLKNGAFNVIQKKDGELTLPIDIFLRSLADNRPDKSVSVILSGTGSDGSRGAVALNSAGGFVIAQSPTQASFDGMPRSVIGTGVVDNVLEAEKIPEVIAKYLDANFKKDTSKEAAEKGQQPLSAEMPMNRILSKLLIETGIDFSLYKEATVARRIDRRMQVKHIPNYQSYAEIIEKDSLETAALRKELLIPVSNFFRDREIFDFIEKNVIEKVLEAHTSGREIRVWVAGCSTGEEAYSYAILLEKALRKRKLRAQYKIFATDVNPEGIEYASKGLYPESASQELPSDIIEQFFTVQNGMLQINQSIRQRVVFAVHNMLIDAPFTKMDIVSCRNTLIYFKSDAQSEVMTRLQYAVLQNGFLVLGKSESLVTQSEFFQPIHRSFKIFTCNKKSPATLSSLTSSQQSKTRQKNTKDKNLELQGGLGAVERIAQQQIRDEFIPLALLIDNELNVVHIYGRDTAILRIKQGTMNPQLTNLLPEKLAPVAVALAYRLNKEAGVVFSDNVTLKREADSEKIVSVRLKGWAVELDNYRTHFVIAFMRSEKPAQELTADNAQSVDVSSETLDRINQLELELSATRESLQSTIEELETTNEELQATNEELMASNEELQSSNEELQSVNEELNTVNAEYHEKVSILNRINADLNAMSLSTGIATVFIDENQNLTRYTPDASTMFKVRDQDLGRPLNEIVNNLNYPGLYDDIADTLKTGRPREVEISAEYGQGYLMRIVGYRLPSTDKFGAAISLIESKSFGSYHKIIDSLPEHIAVLDERGEILLVNEAWKRFAVINSKKRLENNYWIGTNYLHVCNDEVQQGVQSVLSGQIDRYSYKYPCHSPDQNRWYIMEVRSVQHSLFKAVVVHFNVTDWESDISEKQH